MPIGSNVYAVESGTITKIGVAKSIPLCILNGGGGNGLRLFPKPLLIIQNFSSTGLTNAMRLNV